MAEIIKESLAGRWDIKPAPEKLGWQQPIIDYGSEKSRFSGIRMEDFMYDALVQPRTNTFRVFSTPQFSHRGKKYKIVDKFTLTPGKKAIIPSQKSVNGAVTTVNFAKNVAQNYAPMSQPENYIGLGEPILTLPPGEKDEYKQLKEQLQVLMKTYSDAAKNQISA